MVSLEWLTDDGNLILVARVARTFAYGFLSIVLAIYLKLIGVNDILIGLVLAPFKCFLEFIQRVYDFVTSCKLMP